MKFTLSWLADHLDTSASVDQIAEALTDLGLEVEGIENPAEALGAFRICKVIEAVQHPNADRLRVCRVTTYPGGPGTAMEEIQVVWSAWDDGGAGNLRLDLGSDCRWIPELLDGEVP